MSYMVVTSPCIGTKDKACTKICPLNCFFDAGEMLVVHPDECIDCGLCLSECPVNAIYRDDEVPEAEKPFIEKARKYFDSQSADVLEALRIQ